MSYASSLGAHEQEMQLLKMRLHRYIIDEIDEDGVNLLEGARPAVAQYVAEKVGEYAARRQLAISRYELDRLAEEVVDELTGFGPLEVLLRDPDISEILVNGPDRVFIEQRGRLYQSLDKLDASRWQSNGFVVFDSQGSTVRAYQPYLSMTGACSSSRAKRAPSIVADITSTRRSGRSTCWLSMASARPRSLSRCRSCASSNSTADTPASSGSPRMVETKIASVITSTRVAAERLLSRRVR